MIAALAQWRDRLLGRGDASITVPVFDGALRSNRVLDDAQVLAQLDAPQDLATDGREVFVADGARLLRLAIDAAGACTTVPAGEAPARIDAVACLPAGGFALAVDGGRIAFSGGALDGRVVAPALERPLNAVNALAVHADGRLLASDGSLEHGPQHWKHDLMSLGHTGRLVELDADAGRGRVLASGLRHAFGAGVGGADRLVSESWRHRVLAYGEGGAARVLVDGLPGYPSRMAPAAGGGWWLTCFTLRTQLVEFVLREPGFRNRMMREIDPAYWIAPALDSGNTFLEPMQGAQLKMMGVVKPWAPPRSYGLVVRLTADGRIRYSMHSRYDGRHHGIVAAVECDGWLYLLSKGSRRLLRVSVSDAERSLSA